VPFWTWRGERGKKRHLLSSPVPPIEGKGGGNSEEKLLHLFKLIGDEEEREKERVQSTLAIFREKGKREGEIHYLLP